MDRLAFLGAAGATVWATALAAGLAVGTAALAQAPPASGEGAAPALLHDPADLRPEAPLPEGAILPGDPGVTGILCEADPPPIDASGALGLPEDSAASGVLERAVRVENPWTAAAVMTGAGPTVEVVFFKRGRTLIFDAGTEVLYLDRDHRRFTYTQSATGRVTTWHGTCHPEG